MKKLLLLAGGALALWYIPAVIALSRLNFHIESFFLHALQSDYADFSVDLLFENETSIPFTISQIDVQVLVNGAYAGDVLIKDVSVPVSGTGKTNINFSIQKNVIGDDVWSEVREEDNLCGTVTFNVTAHSRGRSYPFQAEHIF